MRIQYKDTDPPITIASARPQIYLHGSFSIHHHALWHRPAVEIMKALGFEGTVLINEYESISRNEAYHKYKEDIYAEAERHAWHRYLLWDIDTQLVWCDPEFDKTQALPVNEWLNGVVSRYQRGLGPPIVVGLSDLATLEEHGPYIEEIEKQCKLAGIPLHRSLEAAVKAAIEAATENARKMAEMNKTK